MTQTLTQLTNTTFDKINSGPSTEVWEFADGTYDNSFGREALSKGGATVKAKNKQKAIITGDPIDVTGQGSKFQDFVLETGSKEQTVVKLSGLKSEFTGNKVRFKNVTQERNDWFNIRGHETKFEGNDLGNKTGLGNMVLVGSGSLIVKGWKILNNWIHDRTTGSVPSSITNGFEMVRMGSSTVYGKDFNGEFAGNTLENYNAPDTELITVKSSSNYFHDNTFKNNNASLTLRHARTNRIENNLFINCGLRIYGRGHTVKGNKFRKNPQNQLRQIVIANGQYAEEEQNTTAGYTQVRDLLFEGNEIDMADSTDQIILCLGYGNYPLKPENNKFINNKISASKGTLANTRDGASWAKNQVSNNELWATGSAKYGDMPTAGYVKKDPFLNPPPIIEEPVEPTPPIKTIDERIADLERRVSALEAK